MSEILEDENLDYDDGEVLNYESFMERVEEANRIEPQKLPEEYFSVYAHSAAYAREHGELEQYRISRNENIACKNAIEAAIRDNFDGMHLGSRMRQRKCLTDMVWSGLFTFFPAASV